MALSQLPAELILEIAKWLNPKAQFRFATTNRFCWLWLQDKITMHRRCHEEFKTISYHQAWKVIREDKLEYVEEIQFIENLPEFLESIMDEDLGGAIHPYFKDLVSHRKYPQDCQLPLSDLVRLKEELEVWRSLMPVLACLLIRSPNVRHLQFYPDAGLDWTIMEYMRSIPITRIKLRSIDIHETSWDFRSTIKLVHTLLNIPTLEVLAVHCYTDDEEDSTGPISKLKDLHLVYRNGHESLARVIARVPRLKRFSIQDLEWTSPQIVLALLATHCSSIKSISVKARRRLDETLYQVPWSKFQSSEALDLSWLDLPAWHELPTTLKALVISDWPGTLKRSMWMRRLCRSLPQLVILELDGEVWYGRQEPNEINVRSED